MDVGVLTYHRCINYGTFWQARCLVDGLRARGHAVRVLDHRSRQAERLELACALRPVLPTRVPATDLPLYVLKALRVASALSRLPRSRRFPLDHPAAMPPCETVVVGSDEVWNLSHPMYAGAPLFFGEGIRTGHLVSYAASLGGFAGELPPAHAAALRSFNALSVRDTNSQRIVESAVGRPVPVVLDPCLQFPPNVRPAFLPRETLVVYGHNFSSGFAASVRAYAKKTGLEILSVGYRNEWADRQWITASPHDFAGAIRSAVCVSTNFFHGCVFSLLAGCPFAAELSPYRSTKVSDLLARLGCPERLAPGDAVADVLSRPPRRELRARLEELRLEGRAYLEAAGV